MRKASTLIGLTLVALGASGPCGRERPRGSSAAAIIVPVPAVPAPSRRSWNRFPPLRRRRLRDHGSVFRSFRWGSASSPHRSMPADRGRRLVRIRRRLVGQRPGHRRPQLGIAPQIIYNVNYKVYPGDLTAPAAGKETDLMARVAYTFPIVETIGLYVAVLPGYSSIGLAGRQSASGLVLAFEGGVDMGITDRIFANLGGGYQLGFQSVTEIDGTVRRSDQVRSREPGRRRQVLEPRTGTPEHKQRWRNAHWTTTLRGDRPDSTIHRAYTRVAGEPLLNDPAEICNVAVSSFDPTLTNCQRIDSEHRDVTTSTRRRTRQ